MKPYIIGVGVGLVLIIVFMLVQKLINKKLSKNDTVKS